MAMKLTDYRLVISIFVITFIAFSGLLCLNQTNVMGSGDDLKMDRDSGIIGEEKTIKGEKQYYEESTGITYHVRKRGTFVTPKVIDGVAYFGSYQPGYSTSLGYSFRLACLDWRYNIIAYWSSPDVTKERSGFSVSLESPDKRTFIDIKEVDIFASTQEQFDIAENKGYIEDPFFGDERIFAAQQAIRWILDKGQDTYKVTSEQVKFTSEQIGNNVFVRADMEVLSRKQNVIKKCVIWALNYRGYRFKSARWIETWICQLITDSSNYSSADDKAHMVLGTLKFDSGRNVYPDLKN